MLKTDKCFLCGNGYAEFYTINNISIHKDRTRKICGKCYSYWSRIFPKCLPDYIPEEQEIRYGARLLEGRKDET
jgi:hypothetical protein